MVSDKHKFIFSHAPRTAGSAFEVNYNDKFKLNIPFGKVFSKVKHMNAAQYKQNFPNKWREYFKFGIVRNPWDHTVSCYYLTRSEELKKQASTSRQVPERYYTFEEWFPRYNIHTRRQNNMENYLFIEDEMVLDSVVAYESYDKDMSKIWKTLFNTEMPYELFKDRRAVWDDKSKDQGVDKVGRPLDFREHYTNKKHIDIVGEIYSKTIEYFGYSFEQ